MSTAESHIRKPSAKPLFGIRTRLILLALLAVVPLTLDRAHMLETSRKERIEQAANDMMELARRGAEQQNEMIISVRALVQAAARAYVATSPSDPEQCARLLDGFANDIPWVSSLSVADAGGNMVCSTESRVIGLKVSDRDYFDRAIKSRQFVMSDYTRGRTSGLPRLMASYAIRAKNGDNAVVVAAMNLEWMGSFAALVGRRPGIVVDLIDSNGVVLARYPQSEITAGQKLRDHPLVAAMLKNTEGHITTEGFDGVRRIYAHVSLPWTSAHLAVGLSEAETLRQIDRMIFMAYVHFALFGLLALISAWLAGEKLIVAPIRALASRAERFGQGEFDAPMHRIAWVAEFRSLVSAFDDMAQKLSARERDLRSANRHLKKLATIDELSGLANRRGFDARLEVEWQLAVKQQRPVGLLMIDVDYFKLFNDCYGHLEGDHCLRGVGEVLSKISKGEADFAARYGGEEFVLLLPGARLDKAVEIAERLRRTMESLSFANTQSPWGFVTVSVGVASMVPDSNDSAEKLVEAADAGLYAAKRRGRNTVVAHDPMVLSEAC